MISPANSEKQKKSLVKLYEYLQSVENKIFRGQILPGVISMQIIR